MCFLIKFTTLTKISKTKISKNIKMNEDHGCFQDNHIMLFILFLNFPASYNEFELIQFANTIRKLHYNFSVDF